jgi:hypothetical protein
VYLQHTDPGGCWVAELDGEIIGTRSGSSARASGALSLFALLPA